MSPMEEIAAATKALYDARDDVLIREDHWSEMFAEDNRCELPEVNRFVSTMNPRVALALADWLSSWEGFEFSEHGPMADDLTAALSIARAVNRGTA